MINLHKGIALFGVLQLAILGLYTFSLIDQLAKKWSVIAVGPSEILTEKCNRFSISANECFAIVHSNSETNSGNHTLTASFILVVHFSSPSQKSNKDGKFVQQLKGSARDSVQMLGEFLLSRKDYDAATCELALRNNKGYRTRQFEDQGINNSLIRKSSWCRFSQRNWSMQIRNQGPEREHEIMLSINHSDSLVENTIVLHLCNIVEGPFLIRSDLFRSLGGLNGTFGKLTWQEFFVRSSGRLRIAKLHNCTWLPEETRADRESLKKSPEFLEYAMFGNKYKILRIITEDRIEWTTCVASWKVCAEKPYINRSHDLRSLSLPICCNVVLGQILEDITWALRKLNIEYRVIYGTLLGGVRSQAIIPWTHDIDIALETSAFLNKKTYSGLQKLLGPGYFVGRYWRMPRALRHLPPSIDVDTTFVFNGPYDTQGDKFFNAEVEEAVKGMLPIFEHWRFHGYADFYRAPAGWMIASTNVTINGKKFVTIKNIDKALKSWYGRDYMKPDVQEEWTSLIDY